MNLGLKDCRAFIAGASRGLGKACAKSLADEGARVFVCSRDVAQIKRAAAEIRAAGCSAADVSRAAEVKRVVAEAIAALGGLDILVTNAGGPPTGPFEDTRDDAWDIAYALTLMSAVRLDEQLRRFSETVPVRRVGRPEEIGDLCAYLCSLQAGYLTGQSIVVDGGITRAI